MLAYAPRVGPATQARSPQTLMLILAGHAAVIAGVLAAKPELVGMAPRVAIKVINVPIDPPPPEVIPPEPKPEAQQAAHQSIVTIPKPIIDKLPSLPIFPLDIGPPVVDPEPVIGPGVGARVVDPPRHVPVKIAALFRTPESAIKPPYPLSKIRSEEEATLKLSLSIDPKGRVVAVEPVGPADSDFLAAARRHIIRYWRYKPAMEDGVAVASTAVISLSFRLDDI